MGEIWDKEKEAQVFFIDGPAGACAKKSLAWDSKQLNYNGKEIMWLRLWFFGWALLAIYWEFDLQDLLVRHAHRSITFSN